MKKSSPAVDERRALVQAALGSSADITVDAEKRELRVALPPRLTPPHTAPSPTSTWLKGSQIEGGLGQEVWNQQAKSPTPDCLP